jgi:hypothetical protein
MSSRNSFISLSEQIMNLQKNSLEVLTALNQVTSSNNSQIEVEIVDEFNNKQVVTFPSVGALKSEIEILKQNIRTLSSVDQRGAIIQSAKNEYKKVYAVDLNREPNPIGQLDVVNNFLAEKNNFLDAFLNPMLKVRLDLSGKIENNVRKILSRRYIINFELDENGNYTTRGQKAIDLFNESFKGRSDVTMAQLNAWVLNTPGIRPNKHGDFLDYDEQEFDLEPNKLQYNGFFTVLGTDEDITNKRMWYKLDTLVYYEIDSNAKRTLAKGDELIINTEFSTTRLKVIEINKEASENRVRFDRVEGQEPIPVGIVGGLKYYSPVIISKKVDISISFNEYNVLFIKAINTENNLVARTWSSGTAYYSNDLVLLSDKNTGDNGKSMTEFYIETVSDFGEVLKDLVDRQVPRHLGIKPSVPVLSNDNFRVVQINKHLTDTPDLDKARKQHQAVLTLRSKLDELSKTISDKRKELSSKQFASTKDKQSLESQIKSLIQDSESTSQLLKSSVNELQANSQQSVTTDPKFRLQGFWKIPNPVENGKTRPQEVIAFRVQYKYSAITGQENVNEPFKVANPDTGEVINAVFSSWTEYYTPTRDRTFDVSKQEYVWQQEDLQNPDAPNINSINIPLSPNEKVEIRVKAISEVGYPDSLLESEWSTVLTKSFPVELLKGRNPEELINKNADLEALRDKIESDMSRKGYEQHMTDTIVQDNNIYHHDASHIAIKDGGKIVSLSDKIQSLESTDKVEGWKELILSEPWANYGNGFSNARYYKNNNIVYLSGMIRVVLSNTDDETDYNNLYPNKPIRVHRSAVNTQWATIAILPDGYRPTTGNLVHPVMTTDNDSSVNDSVTGRMDIQTDGAVVLGQGNSGWVSLDGISFRIK